MKTKVALLTVLILASISAYAIAFQGTTLIIAGGGDYYSEGGPSLVCGTGDDTCNVRTHNEATRSADCSKCKSKFYWDSFYQFDTNCDPAQWSDPSTICPSYA